MSNSPTSRAPQVIWLLAVILLALHQDFWFWDDHETLVLGFIPIGLAYHAGFSLAAAGLWALANHFAWPHDVEAMAEDDSLESLTGGDA